MPPLSGDVAVFLALESAPDQTVRDWLRRVPPTRWHAFAAEARVALQQRRSALSASHQLGPVESADGRRPDVADERHRAKALTQLLRMLTDEGTGRQAGTGRP